MELRAEDVQPGRQQPPTGGALLWLLCRRRVEPLSCHPSASVALLGMYKTRKMRVKTHTCLTSARTASICSCDEEEEKTKLQLEYSRVGVTNKRWSLRHGRVSMTRRRGPQKSWTQLAPTHTNTPPGLVLLVLEGGGFVCLLAFFQLLRCSTNISDCPCIWWLYLETSPTFINTHV